MLSLPVFNCMFLLQLVSHLKSILIAIQICLAILSLLDCLSALYLNHLIISPHGGNLSIASDYRTVNQSMSHPIA